MKLRGKLILGGIVVAFIVAAVLALKFAPGSWLARIVSGIATLGFMGAILKGASNATANTIESLSPGAQSAIDKSNAGAIADGTAAGIAAGEAALHSESSGPSDSDGKPSGG